MAEHLGDLGQGDTDLDHLASKRVAKPVCPNDRHIGTRTRTPHDARDPIRAEGPDRRDDSQEHLTMHRAVRAAPSQVGDDRLTNVAWQRKTLHATALAANRPFDRRRSHESSRASAVRLSIPMGSDDRCRLGTGSAAADNSFGISPSAKPKRKNERSAVTNSFVVLSDADADTRKTAPVMSLAARQASSPLGTHQSRKRRARAT